MPYLTVFYHESLILPNETVVDVNGHDIYVYNIHEPLKALMQYIIPLPTDSIWVLHFNNNTNFTAYKGKFLTKSIPKDGQIRDVRDICETALSRIIEAWFDE